MKAHKKALSWIIDYAYMARGGVVMTYYKKPPAHYLGYVVDGKVPVILIPGIFGKWAFMKHLGDVISFLGHPVHVLPELGYNLSSIPQSAEKLRSAIEAIISPVGGSAVGQKPLGAILVAHSKGGLIGKYFLAHHNQAGNVVGMIAIATPFSGSSFGNFVPMDAIEELDTDSPTIEALEKETRVNDRIVSIIPEYDNHIWAKEGSHLEGAENVHVPVSGHHKVVFDDHVVVAVCKAVEVMTKKFFG
jgi:triacylglycerol lipase